MTDPTETDSRETQKPAGMHQKEKTNKHHNVAFN